MVRKFIVICFVLAAFAAAQGQGNTRGRALMDACNQALQSAKTLHVAFTSQLVTGAPEPFTLDLAKPNKARLDTPTQLVVADGTTITILDKAKKVYCHMAQTDAGLLNLFQGGELSIWKPFFDASGLANVVAATAVGLKTRKNMELDTLSLQMNADGSRTLILFLDPQDNLPRQAEYDYANRGEDATKVIDTQELTVGGALPDSTFTFAATDGSREVTPDEFNAGKWFTSIELAQEVAQRTNKRILVFFFNHAKKPSNDFENNVVSTREFATLSNRFVFVRIDFPRSGLVNKKYKVTTPPTVLFLSKSGATLLVSNGNKALDSFLGDADAASKMPNN